MVATERPEGHCYVISTRLFLGNWGGVVYSAKNHVSRQWDGRRGGFYAQQDDGRRDEEWEQATGMVN